MDTVTYRRATPRDVEAIASLHADSWRRHYRCALPDNFLDGEVVDDRLAVWTERFAGPRDDRITVVAELDEAVAGFAHTVLDEDPAWGALLDNLHVVHHLKRRGIGTRLMAETARDLVELAPSSGLYLWVIDRNTRARAFYEALGGTYAGRESRSPMPGDRLRYVWPDPSVLARAQGR